MVGPDAFTELKFLAHYRQTRALRLLPEYAKEFEAIFGRESGGLLRTYRAEDADMLVVAMGSFSGTIKDVIDDMRDEGIRIGFVTIVAYRPFPADALRKELAAAQDVIVVEKSIAVGLGGPLADNVDLALRNLPRARAAFRSGRTGRTAHHQGLARRPVPAGFPATLGRHAFPRSQ